MKKQNLFYGLAAALIGLSLATAPAMAQTQPVTKPAAAAATTATTPAKPVTKPATPAATKSQADKKPAKSCEGMDKASKAYSDCVKTQAQTTKTDKKPAEPKTAKAADKAKAKTKTN
jgi:disulfide bond formation protein DsbB